MYVYVCVCIYIYIYIHMCMHMYVCIYIYIYTHTHTHTRAAPEGAAYRRSLRPVALYCRPRENMVGVNMVLAEFVKFKHGLYNSCGIVFWGYYARTMSTPTMLSRGRYCGGWRNTVGNLIEFVWLKENCHGLRFTDMCMTNRWGGTVSSNSSFRTVLCQQYSANLALTLASLTRAPSDRGLVADKWEQS